jgi:hypothetical protein
MLDIAGENPYNKSMTTTNNAATENLTFGIEIETKRINNLRAAQAIQAELGGILEHGRDYYQSVYVRLADGRKWRCMNDSSLSGVSSEIVSPILQGREDVETVQRVVRALRRAGARCDEQCGIHVHVGAQGLTAKAVGNLAALVYSREELITRALGVHASRAARYCKATTEEKAKALKGAKTLSDANVAWYGHNNPAPSHYDGTRYAGLNLHNVWFRGTVEFRWFNGTLHAGKVRSYIALCLGLVAYAKSAKNIRVAKAAVSYDDAKWTMYRFLYHRLGLTGDYYKNVRDHLIAALPGSVRGGSRTSDRPGGTRAPRARAAA